MTVPGLRSRKPASGLFVDLAFTGAMMTGPPSLRLMESQSSGKRAEKLEKGQSRQGNPKSQDHRCLQGHNDIHAEVSQRFGRCLLVQVAIQGCL